MTPATSSHSKPAPTRAASRDLELVAAGALDYEGTPTAVVVDIWAVDRPDFRFASRAELVPFAAFAFAADNSAFYAAVADPADLVRTWNLDALFEDDAADAEDLPFAVPKDYRPGQAPACVAADPTGGRYLAIGTTGGEVWLLDTRREHPARRLAAVRGGVKALDFTPDGSAVLATAAEVTLWDISSGSRRGTWPAGATGAAVSPDGKLLGLTDHDGTLTLFDLAAGGTVARYNAGLGSLHSVAFAPDGLTVAAGGRAGRVIVVGRMTGSAAGR